MHILFYTDILSTVSVEREKDSIKYSFYFHLTKFSAAL